MKKSNPETTRDNELFLKAKNTKDKQQQFVNYQTVIETTKNII